ncbi:MAG TPA: hypothetical protein VGJ84_02820 [Polyangiaceae bacterium]|jgi:hypothetical protein
MALLFRFCRSGVLAWGAVAFALLISAGACSGSTFSTSNGAGGTRGDASSSGGPGTGGLVESCTPPFADCNGIVSDGCEAKTSADPRNCGTCDNICTAPANANAICSAGQCKFECATGFADCNGLPTDGCEISTGSNLSNCGGCNNPCTAPQPLPANATGAMCEGGHCGLACSSGFADCDGLVANGCEKDVSTDLTNCGGCGKPCDVGQVCGNGGCTTCPAGWIICGLPPICVNPCLDPNCGICDNNCSAIVGRCCKADVVGCSCSGGC